MIKGKDEEDNHKQTASLKAEHEAEMPEKSLIDLHK